VALVASIVAAGAGCACARADDATVFGVNANRVFNDAQPESSVDTQLAAIAASGLTAVRTDAMWAFIEPWAAGNGALGPFYAETDRRMLALARHRLQWIPVLDYSPGWQQTVPGDDHSAPSDPAAFARFAALFVGRYGRAGAFWHEHPELPYLPVQTYEIWNEENTARFWRPNPEPGRYADLYLLARAAITAIDPAASVAVGGLGRQGDAFLTAMYAARPQLTGNVDAVAIHPYAPTVRGVMNTIDRTAATLRTLDPRIVSLEITEVGWESAPNGSDVLRVPESDRAARMTGLVAAVVRQRLRDHISALLPYTWWTPKRDTADGEDWYGLAADDGSLTPAGAAYVEAIRSAGNRRHLIMRPISRGYVAHRRRPATSVAAFATHQQ
jgi:hypothetical protein